MAPAGGGKARLSRAQRARARIGLSGWNYPAWRDDFYNGVPQRRWLSYCAEHFTSMEVNATFYRELKAETLSKWRDETPDDFAFAAKGHRYITHVRRLREPAESVARQHRAMAPLGDRLAVMLWQLPGNLAKELGRLEDLLAALAKWDEVRHAVEFRDASWFDDEVAERLSKAKVANCISDAADWPMWEAVTTDLVYVRLHGHTRTYASSYAERSLEDWAKRVRGWLGDKRTVYAYFDNDSEGAAPHDALRLMEKLDPALAPA